MLIRLILRWKTALALKRSCNFSREKIERIKTVARHVLLQRNKLQWKFNRNSYIFIQENAFENVVCEILAFCLGLKVLNKSALYYVSVELHDKKHSDYDILANAQNIHATFTWFD